jgi:DNA-binding NtrC family response regulator
MSSVLIVDDEAPIREFLTRWLRASKYDTMEASSADVALTVIGQQEPDVVLCDVNMPGHDGLWLMEQIRMRFPRVAIVLATANDEVPPAISMRRGVVEYLVKPFERRAVLGAVSEAVKWRESVAAAPIAATGPDPVDDWLTGGRK